MSLAEFLKARKDLSNHGRAWLPVLVGITMGEEDKSLWDEWKVMSKIGMIRQYSLIGLRLTLCLDPTARMFRLADCSCNRNISHHCAWGLN